MQTFRHRHRRGGRAGGRLAPPGPRAAGIGRPAHLPPVELALRLGRAPRGQVRRAVADRVSPFRRPQQPPPIRAPTGPTGSPPGDRSTAPAAQMSLPDAA